MKILFYSSLVFCFISCACSPKKQVTNPLQGSWNLVEKQGGFAGMKSIPKNNESIQFTENAFLSFANTKRQTEQHYQIKKSNSIFGKDSTLILFVEQKKWASFLIKQDTLWIQEECYDCYTYKYIRE